MSYRLCHINYFDKLHKSFYVSLVACSIYLIAFSGCTKTSTANSTSSTFIKTIVMDTDYNPISSFQASDGNYIIFTADPNYVYPGWMVKVSATGVVLWKKRLPPNLWGLISKVIPIPGNGFVAIGAALNKPYDTIYAYQYNSDGNIVQFKAIEPFSNSTSDLNSAYVIQLSNGNYAFAGTVGGTYWHPFLMITDNAFNILSMNTYQEINENCYSMALCESPDGSINIAGWFQNNLSANYPANAFLLRTDKNFIQKSFTVLSDTVIQEIPGCIVASNNGIFMLSSKYFANGNGVELTYNTNSAYMQYALSGSIGINHFDTGGHFISRATYSGYPNNGLMNSMRSTLDGGYILCGTVNQLNNVSITSPTEIYLIKADANMNEQWAKTFDTYYFSYGVDACQTTDGGYFISGQHYSFNNHYDMVLIKTDANGNVN
jgi:hypothetical protein